MDLLPKSKERNNQMSQKKKSAIDPKKAYRLMKRLHKQLGQAVALASEASSLLDYEDEKNPTYGIKFRCEKFIKEIRKEWQ